MTLENGDRIDLAGVELAPEAISSLVPLVGGRDIRLLKVIELQSQTPNRGVPVYLFVKGKSLQLPFKNLIETRDEAFMLNEFLILTGGAAVKREIAFNKMADFIRLETMARERGEGIWSYAETAKPAAVAKNENAPEGKL